MNQPGRLLIYQKRQKNYHEWLHNRTIWELFELIVWVFFNPSSTSTFFLSRKLTECKIFFSSHCKTSSAGWLFSRATRNCAADKFATHKSFARAKNISLEKHSKHNAIESCLQPGDARVVGGWKVTPPHPPSPFHCQITLATLRQCCLHTPHSNQRCDPFLNFVTTTEMKLFCNSSLGVKNDSWRCRAKMSQKDPPQSCNSSQRHFRAYPERQTARIFPVFHYHEMHATSGLWSVVETKSYLSFFSNPLWRRRKLGAPFPHQEK